MSATRCTPPIGGGRFYPDVSDRKAYELYAFSRQKFAEQRNHARCAACGGVLYTFSLTYSQHKPVTRCLYDFNGTHAYTTYTGNARKMDILNHSYLVGG